MKIGVLTSSRADFGIYLPLLKKMTQDEFFEVELIAFGTHLSYFYGHTIDHLFHEGFTVPHRIESLVLGDSSEAVSTSMALTQMKFASFWAIHGKRFDLVLCLGDRYEMSSAVMAGIPFGVRFAHFHAGETTSGAIDNIFRHCISLAASVHFVSTAAYEQRLKQLLDEPTRIHTIGALSLDNLLSMQLLSIPEFYQQWNIDLNRPTILVTLHPETVAFSMNEMYARILARVLNDLNEYQIVITMPNADTQGTVIRNVWTRELNKPNVFMVENFGTQSYFSCMKHCSFLIGNTSSGIIEAASFNKYVVNLGARQSGRIRGANVYDLPFDYDSIMQFIDNFPKLPPYTGMNPYWHGGATDKTIEILKTIL